MAWVLSLFPVLRWRVWTRLLALCADQLLFSTVVPRWLILLFPQAIQILANLRPLTLKLILISYAGAHVFTWVQVFVREAFMYRFILAHRKASMIPMEWWRWAFLVVSYPFLLPLADLIFTIAATWRMLWHAVWYKQYKFVTSPKQFKSSGEDALAAAESGAAGASLDKVGTP